MKSLNNPKKRELVTIGRIVKTHGIHGRLRIKYYNEDKSFFSYRRVLLTDPVGHLESFDVTDARAHKDSIIIQLRNVDHIGAAERLVGASVLVEKEVLPALEEGEYYWTDLIGMEVTTASGERLGEVLDVIPTGGTDVFVVKEGEKEVLVPATEEVIRQVDIASRRMVVDLLEGLNEDDSI